MRPVVDRNVVMRHIPVLARNLLGWSGENHEISSLARGMNQVSCECNSEGFLDESVPSGGYPPCIALFRICEGDIS